MTGPLGTGTPVTLRLGAFGRVEGGSLLQRQFGALIVLPYLPALLMLLGRLYLFAAIWALAWTAGLVLILAKARPGSTVTATADDAGIRWHTDRTSSIAWPDMDRVELGRTQPGGKLLAATGMNTGNVRTGDRLMVTVVSGGVPYEVTPVRGARSRSRIAFGAGVARLARSHGVPVRVLTLGWGREDANYERDRRPG